MSANTSIEWTATVHPDGSVTKGRTWNPVRGCSIVSPGCINCYAMKQAHRFSGKGRAYEGLTKQTSAGPQWTGKVRTVESALLDPLKWRKPQRVFVNSMSDLFHEGVPDAFVDRVFAAMSLAKRHTFQILTKRPERMREYFACQDAHGFSRESNINGAIWSTLGTPRGSKIHHGGDWRCKWPLPNVWLGVSAENQQAADERIPLLLETPAAVKFVSLEPLIGPIDIRWGTPGGRFKQYLPAPGPPGHPRDRFHWLNWIIVGGESGPGARPCDVAWIRSIVEQCQSASVPVFVKQLGARPTDGWNAEAIVVDVEALRSKRGAPNSFTLQNRKGGDPSEWPADLRVRQFPGEAR